MPDEARVLTELAIRSKSYWGYSQAFMMACRNELTVTDSSLNNAESHFNVAEVNSKILGFYAVEALGDRGYELDALFVEPGFIGKGVGRALIDHAKNLVQMLGGTTLTIQADPNTDKFYRAAGGKPSGTRESSSIPGRSLPLFIIDLAGDDDA